MTPEMKKFPLVIFLLVLASDDILNTRRIDAVISKRALLDRPALNLLLAYEREVGQRKLADKNCVGYA